MPRLPPFWSAAARLSGRLDLSSCLAAGIDPAAASADELRHHGVSPRHVAALRQADLLTSDALALVLTDPRYPPALRGVPFAPPVLFVLGDVRLLHAPGAALVGARRCSEPARRMAGGLAHAVADAGGVVVSGLAWGVDTAAHVAAGGQTVAVLGQGLGTPFAGTLGSRLRALRSAGGAVVSEYPPDQRPARWTFPQRNRVISGLARATVVVEASARSGSLITARCALDQGRELFVVPDHPSRAQAAGGLSLLAAGVAPLLGPAALLEAIGLSVPLPGARAEPPEAAGLLADLPTAAQLAERTGEPLRTWLQRLAAWELSGQVERLPGGRFGRVRSSRP